jgi:hypothetical protein
MRTPCRCFHPVPSTISFAFFLEHIYLRSKTLSSQRLWRSDTQQAFALSASTRESSAVSTESSKSVGASMSKSCKLWVEVRAMICNTVRHRVRQGHMGSQRADTFYHCLDVGANNSMRFFHPVKLLSLVFIRIIWCCRNRRLLVGRLCECEAIISRPVVLY